MRVEAWPLKHICQEVILYGALSAVSMSALAPYRLTLDLVFYTGIAPRWLAILGLALALILLFGSFYIRWSFLVFPLWVLLLSASILRDSRRATELPAKGDA